MKWYKRIKEDFYWDETCFAGKLHWQWIRFIRFVLQDTWLTCKEQICRIKGHKINSIDSWCTPDSGGEIHECSRCGQSWTINYY